MRLASLVPTIPSDVVSALGKCGIRTDTDLLFTPIIDIFRQLPVDSISLLDLELLVVRVTELVSANRITATHLLENEREAHERSIKLITGNAELDALLGKFCGCHILEISGSASSGKTTLILNIIIHHLAFSAQDKVLWLDTTGDFSIEWATRIVDSSKSETACSVLERLKIALAFDLDAVYASLQEVESDPNIRSVVIDSITPVLLPLLRISPIQGHASMTCLMRDLRGLSQRDSCTFLIINDSDVSNHFSTSDPARALKPALGPTFAFMSDVTLWLEKLEDRPPGGSVHMVNVLRSKASPSNIQCAFRIKDANISITSL